MRIVRGFAILLLGFLAGILGDLVSAQIQSESMWGNLSTSWGLYATLGPAAGVLLLAVALLETEWALAWNWWWHRFWYLQELLRSEDLRRWEQDFARLEIAQGRRNELGITVIVDGKRQDLVEVLTTVIAGRSKGERRALVVGEPGSGKTTGLERLTLEMARQATKHLGGGYPVPVLLRLGDFQEGNLLEYAGERLQAAVKGRSGKVLSRGLKHLIEHGRVALLLDALDEALGERREVVLAQLSSILANRTYRAPMVVTSRTREDIGDRLAELPIYEIQDLSDEAAQVIVRAYKPEEHNEEEIWDRLKRYELLEPHGLGRNPLLLSLIVKTGGFVGSKGQILDQSVDQLLGREWDKPVTKRPLRWAKLLPRDDQLRETKLGLAWLAYWMTDAGQVMLNQRLALDELAAWLRGRSVAEGLRPRDVLEFAQDAQLLTYQADPVRFRHRLFQELMTAWALEEGLPVPMTGGLAWVLSGELLERYVRDEDRWEILLILAGLTRNHYTLVQGVLGDGRDVQRLFLAMGLLWAVDEPDQRIRQRISAVLAVMLRRGVTEECRLAARTTLTRIGDEGTLKAARDLLEGSDDESLRQGAVEVIGALGSVRAVRTLIGYLGDRRVREPAVTALVQIGEPAVRALIAALQHENKDVREVALTVLVQIGEPAVRALIAALRDEDEGVRWRTALALGEIKDARAAEPLIAALRDEDDGVRWKAVEALGRIGELAVGALIAALRHHEDSDVRRRAADVLTRIKDARAVGALVAALRDEDKGVRGAAAVALGEIKDARAVEPLIATLRDEDERVRGLVASVLGRIGDARAVEPLIAALRDEDERVRRRVALALGDVKDARAVEPLIAALRDEDGDVRRRVVATLGEIKDARAVEPLIAALGDEDKGVRGAVAVALGEIKDVRAVEPLIAALGDEDEGVRGVVATALANLRRGL